MEKAMATSSVKYSSISCSATTFFPYFDGSDPLNWIYTAELYFESATVDDDIVKFRFIFSHTKGSALVWLWSLHRSMRADTWEHFLDDFTCQYGLLEYRHLFGDSWKSHTALSTNVSATVCTPQPLPNVNLKGFFSTNSFTTGADTETNSMVQTNHLFHMHSRKLDFSHCDITRPFCRLLYADQFFRKFMTSDDQILAITAEPVFACLLIDIQNRGTRMFIVSLQSFDTWKTLRGISIDDVGMKFGKEGYNTASKGVLLMNVVGCLPYVSCILNASPSKPIINAFQQIIDQSMHIHLIFQEQACYFEDLVVLEKSAPPVFILSNILCILESNCHKFFMIFQIAELHHCCVLNFKLDRIGIILVFDPGGYNYPASKGYSRIEGSIILAENRSPIFLWVSPVLMHYGICWGLGLFMCRQPPISFVPMWDSSGGFMWEMNCRISSELASNLIQVVTDLSNVSDTYPWDPRG